MIFHWLSIFSRVNIGESVAGPVVDLAAGGGNGVLDINGGDAGLHVGGGSVAVVPVEQTLDGTA
jgi:hypothetical protein